MINPEDFHISPQQLEEFMARKSDGQRKSRARKKSKISFLKIDVAFWHKLVDDRSGWKAWAMVGALYEAWFTTGIYLQHPNPFPLVMTDATRWGLNRKQKYQALKFLVRIRLIEINRSNPKNPLVTLTWVPHYSPEAS